MLVMNAKSVVAKHLTYTVEPIRLRKSHEFSNARAVAIVNAVFAKLEERYEITSHWEGLNLYFEATAVAGVVQLEPGRVSVEVTLGFLLMAVHDEIRMDLDRELDEAFRARPARIRQKQNKGRRRVKIGK